MASKPLFNPNGLAAAREQVVRTGFMNRSAEHTTRVTTGLSPAQEVRLGLKLESMKKELSPLGVEDVKEIAKAAIPYAPLADVLVKVANKTFRGSSSAKYEPIARTPGVPVKSIGPRITTLPGNTALLLRRKLLAEKAGFAAARPMISNNISQKVVLEQMAQRKGFGLKKANA